ncbi:MAG: cTPxI [Alyxoria varia]|nr:MAG: cTPxI [Alyxoria varia]
MSRPGSTASGYFSPRLNMSGSTVTSPKPFALQSPSAWAMAYPPPNPPRVTGVSTVGDSAPRFVAKAVIDGRIKEVSLSSYMAQDEWVILVFIPMAWSFICPTEILAFDRRIKEFERRTATVAFCSTDSEYVLRAWNAIPEDEGGLGGVHVPLISDRSHAISKGFGVLIENEGVAQRALFLIDPRGNIRHVAVQDANVGRSVDEAKRLLDALTFTDEFGQGCPIGWKKGDAGLKMTHESDADTSAASKEPFVKPRRPVHKRGNTWSGWHAQGVGVSSPTDVANSAQNQRPATALPVHRPRPQQQMSERQPPKVPMGVLPENPGEEIPATQTPSASMLESTAASNWAALNNNSKLRSALWDHTACNAGSRTHFLLCVAQKKLIFHSHQQPLLKQQQQQQQPSNPLSFLGKILRLRALPAQTHKSMDILR